MEQVENLCWKIFDTEKRFFFTSTLPRSVPTNKGGMQKIGSLVGNTHLAFFFLSLSMFWHQIGTLSWKLLTKFKLNFALGSFFGAWLEFFLLLQMYKDLVGWDMAFPTRHDNHYRHFKHDIYLPMYN